MADDKTQIKGQTPPGGEKQDNGGCGCCWGIFALIFINVLAWVVAFSFMGSLIGVGDGNTMLGGDGSSTDCTSNQISIVDSAKIALYKPTYELAASATNVSWEFIATLHARESNLSDFKPKDGPFQVQGSRNLAFSYAGAVEAATKAKGLASGSYGVNLTKNSSTEDIKLAFLAYNRGVMYKRGGCSVDSSPYVMNQFDATHQNMRWNDNECEPDRNPPIKGKINTQVGALAIYSALKGKILGSSSCDEVSIPTGKLCGVVPVSTANIVHLGGDLRLMPPAANDFNKMASDFKNKTGKNLPINSMFRTRAKQAKLCEGTYINPKGKTKCNNKDANPPGNSMHEAGLAIDTDVRGGGRLSLDNYKYLASISHKYNFEFNNTKYGERESWHLDYTGTKNQYWYGAPKITNAINAANRTNCN